MQGMEITRMEIPRLRLIICAMWTNSVSGNSSKERPMESQKPQMIKIIDLVPRIELYELPFA